MKRFAWVFTVILSLGSVSGTTINWKGLTWNVQDSTSAAVDGSGNMVITVNANDADDPDYENWNVSANLTPLNLGAGSWVEFTFLGRASGGGPRAFLNTTEASVDYIYQAGSHPTSSEYQVNAHTYSHLAGDFVYGEWFPHGPRSEDQHTFKAVMLNDTAVQLYFDGSLLRTVAAADTPTFFETAYLGVMADVFSDSWGPNDIRPGTYTDFRWGTSVPETGSTLLLLAAALTGLAILGRRFHVQKDCRCEVR